MDYPVQSISAIGAFSLLVAALLIFLLVEKERMSRKLRRKTMEDSLTQLYNASACRTLVSERLEQMKSGQRGALLIMDFDNFKEVNDFYGHQMGDNILGQFADMLRGVFDKESIVARVGGDEFAAFMCSVESDAEIHRVCSTLRDRSHSILAGDERITISIDAISAYAHNDYDALYRLADKALYRAKGNMKDQYFIAESPAVDM